MKLTDNEARVMTDILKQNGCKCTNETREVVWFDQPPFRIMNCKCGIGYAVPIMFIRNSGD